MKPELTTALRGQRPMATNLATILIDAELRSTSAVAQLARYDIPAPMEASLIAPECYQINMCLTPRPLHARACYRQHWGPHRFERLGDIFMVPPGEELYIKGDSGRQATVLCFIEARAVNELIGHDLAWTEQKLAATIDVTNARVRALLLRLTEEVRHPALAAERMLDALAAELAIELARFCLEVDERPANGGLAGWRLRLIDERLSEDPIVPPLTELATLCNISIRQLTRGFKASRGRSIGDYMEQRRLELAKRMLVDGESIKAIAFVMGYTSPSSFTFAFRRAAGSSPTEFRQRQTRGVTISLDGETQPS